MIRSLIAPLALFPAALLAQENPDTFFASPMPPSGSMMLQVLAGDTGSYLGVGGKDITPDSAKNLKLKDEYGVELTSVDPDSSAAKAGLKVGDVVLEYNGQRVEGFEQFQRMIRETPVGRTVRLQISREGKAQTITATLGKRMAKVMTWPGSSGHAIELPNFQTIMPDIPSAMMGWRSQVLGVYAEALEPQLATYFGVKEGVLVRSVNSGSAAEKAGLKAGDVILKVDETKVTTPREVSNAIRSAGKNSVTLAIMREHKESAVSVNVPEEQRRPTTLRASPIRHFQQ